MVVYGLLQPAKESNMYKQIITLFFTAFLTTNLMHAETVEFPNGAVCAACKVVINAGTIYKVTRPNSTGWDIPCQSTLEVDGVRYLTPKQTSIVYPCIQKKLT